MKQRLIDANAFYCRVMSQPTELHYPSWYGDMVKDMPTINPVRHAHWTEKYDGYMILCVCSICNARTIMKSNYCPNCGAKMDEKVK